MNDASPSDGTSGSSETGPKKRSQKIKLIEHFFQSLEALIFAQIAVLYYCDNSTFLLILRLLSQLFFVNPGPGPPNLPPVMVANALAIVTHLVQAQPAPESSSRGYLHGGILIDFVGQKPAATWTILSLDIFVFGLQILMLLGALAKQKEAAPSTATSTTQATQDLDAEEAGFMRDEPTPGQTVGEEGIELEDLSSGRRILQTKTLHGIYAGEEMLIELNLFAGLQNLFQSRTLTTSAEDTGGGVLGNILLRLAAARSQTGSED